MQHNWLGRLLLADERKVDIPVNNSIRVVKEYTDLQYLFFGLFK